MMFKLLELLGVPTSGYNRLMIHFAALKSGHSLAICLGLAALFALSAYFMVQPLATLRRKVIILALHAAALAIALAIFLQPELRLAAAQKIKSPVAVLVDSSESMSVAAGGGKSRVQAAQEWLNQNRAFFTALAADYEVHWFSFDEKLTALPSTFPDAPQLKAQGPDTRTLEALSQIRREIGNKPLSGVVVLSDGADRSELGRSRALKADEQGKFNADLKKNLAGAGRVYAVLTGSGASLKDLAVTGLEHDSYGFVKNPFVVVVKLKALGDIPRQSSVTLWQEDKQLVTKPVTLEPGKEQKIELEFTPQEVGRFLFKVEMPVYPGEASAENNSKYFPLTIIRDRIRVLYIVGNPSWDEKFLRQTLRKNPAVDLVSFYILREWFDDPRAGENELALIPFPTNKLFTDELSSFDLIIFQNFFGASYMFQGYISNLRDYVVEKGGAFIYLGGPRAFLNEPFNVLLQEILPVDFAFAEPNYKEAQFKVELTEKGGRHPLTRLLNDDADNKRMWDSIAEFDGYNQVLRAKPDALVLATARTADRAPLIAAREAGKGRVLAVMTDSLWRWHFSAGGVETSKYYQLFWERSLRWLMRDPEMKPLSLSSVKEVYAPGEEINLFFQVQDSSYEPVGGATVTLDSVKAPENCKPGPVAGAEVSPGKYRFTLKLDCAGGYRFSANAVKAGAPLGSDQEIVVVSRESAEMDDLTLHPELLQTVTDATGGKLLKIDQSADRIKFDKLKLEEITSAKDIPVWNNWVAWFALVALFGLTWGVRRYWGLS